MFSFGHGLTVMNLDQMGRILVGDNKNNVKVCLVLVMV